MTQLKMVSLLSLAVAIAAPGVAWAQDSAVKDDSGDIIVTAQRRSERLQDVPISMSVQSSEQIAKAGIVDTRGLEQVTPGLSFQAQSSFINPAIRGISTTVVTAGADNPIAIYLDGAYVSSFAGSVMSLPDVERIEVLKGPQGTLFGRNATGGAIQILTKSPSFTPTGKLTLTGGYFDGAGTSRSASDLLVSGYVSGPIVADRLAASVAFSYQDSNGYSTNIAYAQVRPEEQRAFGTDRLGMLKDVLVRGKLLFTPTDNFKALVSAYYSKRRSDRGELGYVARDGLATATSGWPDQITGSKPWQYAYDTAPMATVNGRGANLKMDLELDPGTITSTTTYSRTKSTEDTDTGGVYAPSCLAVAACVNPRDSILDKNFSQEILFTSKKLGRVSFVAGANYFSGDSTVDVAVNDFSVQSPVIGSYFDSVSGTYLPINYGPIFYYNQQVKTKAWAVFAESNISLTDELTLIAGIRYSDEKKNGILHTFGAGFPVAARYYTDQDLIANKATAWTPRVSLRYAVTSRSNVYATWSRGFHSGLIPGGDPRYIAAQYGTGPGQVDPATAPANVKPERLDAYEIGFKTAQPGYSFNIAAFYYRYSDVQVQASLGQGGTVIAIYNAAKARIYGLDMDGTVQLAPGLSLRGGVSWIPEAKYLSFPGAVVAAPPNNGTPYVDGQVLDISGHRMFKTPKLTLTAGATYEADLAGGTLSISPNLYYASSLFVDPTYGVHCKQFKVGAEIAYEPEGSSFRFSLWGKNLTNDHAFVGGQFTSAAWVLLPGDPRELGATATFKF